MKFLILIAFFVSQQNLFGQKDFIIDEFSSDTIVPAELPKGGESSMARVSYPQNARKNGIKGTVIISFFVELDGSLTNWKIVKDIGGGCGEEALRVFKTMPNWIPATKNGIPFRSEVIKPMKFYLG
jgi:TonB family protein